MATANELREMKPEELDRMLTEQREALFNLRLKALDLTMRVDVRHQGSVISSQDHALS